MRNTKLPGKAPVLVVDDDETFLQCLGDILELWSYRVLRTTRAREALEIIGRKAVNLVLLDFQMPEMNGLECLQHIRRFHPGVRVVMVTGCSFDPGVFIDHGATAVLRKPFDVEMLHKLLDKLTNSCDRGMAIPDAGMPLLKLA